MFFLSSTFFIYRGLLQYTERVGGGWDNQKFIKKSEQVRYTSFYIFGRNYGASFRPRLLGSRLWTNRRYLFRSWEILSSAHGVALRTDPLLRSGPQKRDCCGTTRQDPFRELKRPTRVLRINTLLYWRYPGKVLVLHFLFHLITRRKHHETVTSTPHTLVGSSRRSINPPSPVVYQRIHVRRPLQATCGHFDSRSWKTPDTSPSPGRGLPGTTNWVRRDWGVFGQVTSSPRQDVQYTKRRNGIDVLKVLQMCLKFLTWFNNFLIVNPTG